MKKITSTLLVSLLLTTPVFGETVYVNEQHSVPIRNGMNIADPVLGRAATGTGLDVLERNETHTRVRSGDGTEGWIANDLLTREKPAELRILSAETRAKHAQAEAAKLAQQVSELEAKLKAREAEVQAAAVPAPSEPATPTKLAPELLWFGISFAMLVIGFAAGMLWWRERTRRKLGGMHIRVS